MNETIIPKLIKFALVKKKMFLALVSRDIMMCLIFWTTIFFFC